MSQILPARAAWARNCQMRHLAGIQVETVQVFARNSDEKFESPAWKPRCCGFGWMQSPQFAEGTWEHASFGPLQSHRDDHMALTGPDILRIILHVSVTGKSRCGNPWTLGKRLRYEYRIKL